MLVYFKNISIILKILKQIESKKDYKMINQKFTKVSSLYPSESPLMTRLFCVC